MKILYTLTAIVLFAFSARAGDSTGIVDNLLTDFKTGFNNSVSFFTSPLSFSESDWLIASGITAGTLLMFAFDDELETTRPTVFSRNQSLTDILLHIGEIDYVNVFSIGFYTTGLLTRNDDIRTTGRLLIESLFLSGSTALILRLVTGRPRPFIENNSSFRWFKRDWHYQSFPSGHTTVVFALSTVLAERIDNDWARAGIYGLAGVAAVERIYSNQHWFSDVIIGGLLGYGSAVFVLNKESGADASSGTEGVSIYPSIQGLNLIWRF